MKTKSQKSRASKDKIVTSFPHELFVIEASKSQKQKIKIVEAFIESVATVGLNETSYTTLAERCKISRTLIHHYFPTMESLFLLTSQYVRKNLLEMATADFALTPNRPDLQLATYVEGCFKWVRSFPTHVSFWMLYYYNSSHTGKIRQLNGELVSQGHERIESLILNGKELGLWSFQDSKMTSKAIQVVITGAIVSCITEDGYINPSKAADLTNHLIKGILKKD